MRLVCKSSGGQGSQGRFGIAKAGHADAYEELPLNGGDDRAAVVNLRHPVDGELFGSIPRTQLYGATAAVIRYGGLSRVMSLFFRLELKPPRAGYQDIAHLDIVGEALSFFAEFSKLLRG